MTVFKANRKLEYLVWK